jgi:ADP-ribosyltransferase exoenzyme
MTALLAAQIEAKFDPAEKRDLHGKWTAEGVAQKAGTLGLGEKFDHNGHTVSRTVNGYRVKLKSGEAKTFDLPSQAGHAAHAGNLGGAPAVRAPVQSPKAPARVPPKPARPSPATPQPAGGLKGGQAYKSVDEPFAPKDKNTANMYTVASAGINRPLRNGEPIPAKFKGFARDMDALFKRTLPTDKDVVAYRGTVSHVFPPNSAGKTYVDKGFASLSTEGKDAAQYGPVGDTAVMEIFVPKGSKVMKPGSSSQYAVNGVDGDQELVLNRGGRYEITADRMVNGVRHLSVIYGGPA